MKFIGLMVLLACSLQAFADTRVEITPTRPVDCKVSNHPSLNWIYDLEKIAETESELEVEFKTMYGSCEKNQINIKNILFDLASIRVFRAEYIVPFIRTGVKTELIAVGNTEAIVKLRFNKDYIFKKSTKKSFRMFFNPGGWRQVESNGWIINGTADFEWMVDLELNPATKMTALKIRQ